MNAVTQYDHEHLLSQNVLDKKMNGPYNVVVGESFTMDIAHVRSSMLYMYFGGHLGITVWRTS